MSANPPFIIPPGTIPIDLLPGDGRFGSGPSKIQNEFVNDLAGMESTFLGTSHRRDPVKSVVGSIRSGLAAFYDLPDGYEVVLGVGGATAFWDAAVFGLIEERSAHFVCGEFSHKFATSVQSAPHLGEPIILEAPPGDAPSPIPVHGVDVASFIHNETSTGVTAPFERLSDALVVVDGTSGVGAIPFDVPSVDVYYFSPQKALGSEGGLWLALMSPAAIDRIARIARSQRWIPPFLSLATAVDNSMKNQTYNTPALATLYLLDRQLSGVLDRGGLSWAAERCRDSSSRLYRWAEGSDVMTPFVSNPTLRSTTVVTIDVDPQIDADAVSYALRLNGIVDTESYRKLGRNQLRIATFPNVDPGDITALTHCIDFVVDRLQEARAEG
ncbi:MAG: phosphoserine transaminase [Acidimicrobiia bacterium]|nr:phosphoserine transaminase [Acidimicrobiia bacterium]